MFYFLSVSVVCFTCFFGSLVYYFVTIPRWLCVPYEVLFFVFVSSPETSFSGTPLHVSRFLIGQCNLSRYPQASSSFFAIFVVLK